MYLKRMLMWIKNLDCEVKEMFDYTIHSDNSADKFKSACEKIEKAFPEAAKQKLLVDVDGSTIQTYTLGDKDIDIYDDYEVGAVYIKSEIELGIF